MATTSGTTPTMIGSSKVGFTRNLASVSRTVLGLTSLATGPVYAATASANDRSVVALRRAMTAHELTWQVYALGRRKSSVGPQIPGRDLRRHRTVEDTVKDATALGINDSNQRLDPAVEVSMHQVSAPDPVFVVPTTAEAHDARVLEEPAEYAWHPNVRRQASHARAQCAHASHDQVDRGAGPRCGIQLVDQLLVDQAVDLHHDAAQQPGDRVARLATNHRRQSRAHGVGRDQQRLVRVGSGVSGQVIEQVSHVAADCGIRRQQADVLIHASGLRVVVTSAKVRIPT